MIFPCFSLSSSSDVFNPLSAWKAIVAKSFLRSPKTNGSWNGTMNDWSKAALKFKPSERQASFCGALRFSIPRTKLKQQQSFPLFIFPRGYLLARFFSLELRYVPYQREASFYIFTSRKRSCIQQSKRISSLVRVNSRHSGGFKVQQSFPRVVHKSRAGEPWEKWAFRERLI